MKKLFDVYRGAPETVDKTVGTSQTSDFNLIHFEFYNAHKHEVLWVRDRRFDEYIAMNRRPLGPVFVRVKAGEFQYFPHKYWVPSCEKGCPAIEGVMNLDEMIGKGNKLPSLPIVDKKFQSKD